MQGNGLGIGSAGDADRRATGRERRGQTTLDFAIGMSIFLLALTFLLAFVPGMLEPFSGGAQSETPSVNRVADDLTQRTLSDTSDPYVLDGECTAELFTSGAPAACQYDGTTLADKVGIRDYAPVNVTIRGDLDESGDNSVLCWNSVSSALEEKSGSCGTVLSGGSKPGGSGGKTVSARRVALLDGHDVTVEVVMW